MHYIFKVKQETQIKHLIIEESKYKFIY